MTGNQPGADSGDVQVFLVNPLGTLAEFIVPSDDLTLAVEAGQVIGLQVELDGRRLFVPWSNVCALLDAPVSKT